MSTPDNVYGVRWPDGSETGAITPSYRLAASYAKDHQGTLVQYGEDGKVRETGKVEEVSTE